MILSDLLKFRWAYGNRCRKLHILPENQYTPAVCGFEPTTSGRVIQEWSVVKNFVVEGIVNKSKAADRHTLCKKCLEIKKEVQE
jgi:hypothetical protein